MSVVSKIEADVRWAGGPLRERALTSHSFLIAPAAFDLARAGDNMAADEKPKDCQ
jgi:hypothetical protein